MTRMLFTWLIIPFLFFNFSQAEAHTVTEGRSTQSLLVLWEDKVQITFNLGFGPNEGHHELIKVIDKNNDQTISPEEKDSYLQGLRNYVINQLSIYVDGKKIPLKIKGLSTKDNLSTGKITEIDWAIDFWFEIEGSLKDLPPVKWHVLEYQDATFNDPGITTLPIIHVSYKQQVKSLKTPFANDLIMGSYSYTIYDRVVKIQYSLSEELGGYSGVRGTNEKEKGSLQQKRTVDQTPIKTNRGRRLAEEDRTAKAMSRFFEQRGFWAMLMGIVLAIVFGAYHSLLPGHGKSLLVAYTIGAKGRIRDAIVLGITMAVAHTGGIILVALLSYFVAERYLGWTQTTFQTKATLWTSIISGLIITFMGIRLLVIRVKNNGHEHMHVLPRSQVYGPITTNHMHVNKGETCLNQPSITAGSSRTFTARELISLGISGGIVPCPTAILILLISFATQQLLLGLAMLVAFSIGLGGVLVGICIILVKSKNLIEKTVSEEGFYTKLPFLRNRTGIWFKKKMSSIIVNIPILSASIVTLIGLYILYHTVTNLP